MTPRAILEPGSGGKEKHVSDLTGGGQPREEGQGVAQPNPGHQSHCRGTWGHLLHLPAIAEVSVLFPGGERGGEPKPTWSPHVLCSPLPSSPSFHLSRNRIFLPLPGALSSSDSDTTPGKTQSLQLRRCGFGDAEVQQEVEKVCW